MKLDLALIALSLLSGAAASSVDSDHAIRSDVNEHELYKRRGGGGGGGSRGGGGGGSSRPSSGNSGSNGNSGNSGGGSRGSSRPGPASTAGGVSSRGGGSPRSFGGGRYYAGGAPVPYRAGSTIGAGLAGGLLVGSALAFWPGVWLYGAYNYNYYHHHHDDDDYDNIRPGDLGTYTFFNETSDRNETLPVFCACGQFSVCGCDDDVNEELLDELVGDGDWFDMNHTLINTGRYEGNKVLLVNGTLANDTTVAEGDVDQAEQEAFLQDSDSAAARGLRAMGYWPAAAAVAAAVFLA